MSLKYKLETIDELDEATKSLYVEKDGAFYLQVEDLPEPKDNGTEDLKERLKKLEKNNQELLEEKRKAKEEADRVAAEAAKKSGDVETLEKSWQEKLNSEVTAREQKLKDYETMLSVMTVGSEATRLAAEVFGDHSEIMMPHIKSRLSYEIVDGHPKVRVLDSEGRPTAASVDDLKNEFKNSDKFAPFVVGSRASGAGAHSNRQGGGAVKKFNEMTGEELKELREKDPQTYDRIKKEYYGG